jgi:uncharacterized protein involved in oxidation of intracellular sulfur
MKKVTVIINDGPGSMRSWNALRLASGMLDANIQVKIILFDDAVFCAKKGPKPPEGLEGQNLADKLKELAGLDVAVLACGTCMRAKGILKEELTDGVIECCMMDVCNSIKESDNVLVF